MFSYRLNRLDIANDFCHFKCGKEINKIKNLTQEKAIRIRLTDSSYAGGDSEPAAGGTEEDEEDAEAEADDAISTAGDMGELLRRANLELGGAVPQRIPHTGTENFEHLTQHWCP
jgi:hypothetical protein